MSDIVSAEELKDISKTAIDDMEYNLAIHILETLRDNYADEYEYCPLMGTLETPIPIEIKCEGKIE